MERSPERNGVLKICEELGIGFVPWGPVGMVAPETVLYFSIFRVPEYSELPVRPASRSR
jgi:hypothetical protein